MKTPGQAHETATLWDTADAAWEPENSAYPVGSTEKTTRETITELLRTRIFTPAEKTLAQLCIALAHNIDRGNQKGRAIANEAMQLAAVLEQLTATADAGGEHSDLPPELRTLLDAFRTPPRLADSATPSHAA